MTKASRRAVAQRRKPRSSTGNRWRIAILIGGAVIALALGIVALSPNTTPALEDVVSYTNLPRDHSTAPQTYPQSPPVGGVHDPVWQNCGVYDQPIRNENAVHSLEHGAVWITYQPDLPAGAVATIRALAKGHYHVLVSPYPGLTNVVVASAWGLQLRLDDVNDPRLAQFISRYEKGPQTPEQGAACDSGTGTPIAN